MRANRLLAGFLVLLATLAGIPTVAAADEGARHAESRRGAHTAVIFLAAYEPVSYRRATDGLIMYFHVVHTVHFGVRP